VGDAAPEKTKQLGEESPEFPRLHRRRVIHFTESNFVVRERGHGAEAGTDLRRNQSS
jgi:hypothetical protein